MLCTNVTLLRILLSRRPLLGSCDRLDCFYGSYGYNNLEATVPLTVTFPKEQPINRLSDMMRSDRRRMAVDVWSVSLWSGRSVQWLASASVLRGCS